MRSTLTDRHWAKRANAKIRQLEASLWRTFSRVFREFLECAPCLSEAAQSPKEKKQNAGIFALASFGQDLWTLRSRTALEKFLGDRAERSRNLGGHVQAFLLSLPSALSKESYAHFPPAFLPVTCGLCTRQRSHDAPDLVRLYRFLGRGGWARRSGL